MFASLYAANVAAVDFTRVAECLLRIAEFLSALTYRFAKKYELRHFFPGS